MSWHIVLDTWVRVKLPSPAYTVARLENGMVNEVLELGLLMLELMGKKETTITCTDGYNLKFARCVCWLIDQWYANVLKLGHRRHDVDSRM